MISVDVCGYALSDANEVDEMSSRASTSPNECGTSSIPGLCPFIVSFPFFAPSVLELCTIGTLFAQLLRPDCSLLL